MLLAIRDRVTGVFAWIICIIIIVPFAFWGVGEYVGVGSEPAAVKFNDSEMTMYELERRMQINRQQLAQRFGGQIPEFLDNNDTIRQQTLNQFVDREALVQYIQNNRYGSGAQEIYRNISSLPQFQQDGKFSIETYERQLSSQGYTKGRFEEQVGIDIAIGQLQQGIVATALSTDKQVQEYVRLRNETRDFEYFELNITDYQDKVSVDSDAVNTYYEENKERLTTERQMSINYLELKASDIADSVVVDDAKLRELYENDEIPGIADKPESRKASHILLLVDETASPEDVAKKEADIQQIKQRAETEDFAVLAKELSEDAGSAQTGGDLGDVVRGVMVKPFEDALFDMQEGSVSEVVKTQFGFHIIKLHEINAAQKPAFDEVKDKIASAYKNQESEKVFFEKADQLANLTFEQSDTLAGAAEELGIEIKTTPLFTPEQGLDIASNQQVRAIAFSDEVLEQGINSEPVEIANNHIAIIRLNEYKPQREKTLEEASPEINTILRNQQASEMITKDLDEAFAKADATDLAQLASTYGAELQQADDIDRQNRDIDFSIVEEVFLIVESNGLAKVSMPNGSKALVKLGQVKEGQLATLTDDLKTQVENEWLLTNGRSEFDGILTAYKEKADIYYNPEFETSAQ